MMLFKRDNLESRSNVRVRITILAVAATLLVALIGLGAASPALADHDYRSGPSVEFRAAFPLPLLFPVRVGGPQGDREVFRREQCFAGGARRPVVGRCFAARG